MPMTRRTTVYGTLVPLNSCLQAVPTTSDAPAKITASTELESLSSAYDNDRLVFSGDMYDGNATSVTLVISVNREQKRRWILISSV